MIVLSWDKMFILLSLQQERQERRIMASRPFSSLLLFDNDLKKTFGKEQGSMQVNTTTTCSPAGGNDQSTTFQRTFSKRNKRKQNYPVHNPVCYSTFWFPGTKLWNLLIWQANICFWVCDQFLTHLNSRNCVVATGLIFGKFCVIG